MTFNLDQEISRQGTNSTKWEFEFGPNGAAYSDRSDPKYRAERLLPMWVADMDFRCPPAVVEALVARRAGRFMAKQTTSVTTSCATPFTFGTSMPRSCICWDWTIKN